MNKKQKLYNILIGCRHSGKLFNYNYLESAYMNYILIDALMLATNQNKKLAKRYIEISKELNSYGK